jgi:hypothetical protein
MLMRCSKRAAILLLLACGGCESAALQRSDASVLAPAGSGGTTSPPGVSLSAGEGGDGQRSSTAAGRGAPVPAIDAAAADGGARDDAGSRGPEPDAALPPTKPGDDDLDAGPAPGDAGTVMLGTGGCCTENDTPGCSNADLEVCVCEKLPACCTDAWSKPCVLIVEQKFCQAGVRDCVCGKGDGQWAQTACCETNWTDTFCDQVAETKCGAIRGCF